jgi:hypothetical protein
MATGCADGAATRIDMAGSPIGPASARSVRELGPEPLRSSVIISTLNHHLPSPAGFAFTSDNGSEAESKQELSRQYRRCGPLDHPFGRPTRPDGSSKGQYLSWIVRGTEEEFRPPFVPESDEAARRAVIGGRARWRRARAGGQAPPRTLLQ